MVDNNAREEKRRGRKSIDQLYKVLGKVNEGTFGVVYKAIRLEDKVKWEQNPMSVTYLAIKQPKNPRPGEGFNKDAVREIALLQELSRHPNIVTLREVVLQPDGDQSQRGLCLVFDWAEYELCDILKAHRDKGMPSPSTRVVKSIMWQILNGINYIHNNWVVHRDLKPSNILIMGRGPDYGRVKIADFGMARLFQQPLRALHYDGVVVTVWYRAPELLLGAKHYTKAIDMWAIGCIFGELLTSSPLFQGKEDKHAKAFQEDQLRKIFKVVGTPTAQHWKQIEDLPEWSRVATMNVQQDKDTLQQAVPYLKDPKAAAALDLLKRFFDYDPGQRITAMQAMEHQYFKEVPFPLMNVWQDGNGSATGATDPALSYGQRHVHNVGMDGLTMAPQQGSQQQQRGQHHHQQQQQHQQHHQQSRQHQQHQQQQMQYNMQYNMQQHDQSMAGQKRAQGGQQYGGQQSKMQRK